jgi:hypothetical protein
MPIKEQKIWVNNQTDSLWIYEKILEGYCEVTGIPFDLTSEVSNSVHAKNPWVPSIDRVE